ncbi:MAG: hypothetical protein CTY15_03730 [Methylocystis sp.]|nr:MAG: hypothetical protein CTY15_03730 [Methylocystis sp.]
MPNFDCGAYFLSTLIPVKTAAVEDPRTGAQTSPVQLLRSALAGLKTAQQVPEATGVSPFAKNMRNHFVRMVVIEDVAYVGRKPINALLTVLTELLLPARFHINPVTPQDQDHLSNPFLFFSADFDARSGDASERDAYLKELWTSAGDELREVFRHCERFDEVTDAESFAAYIARCQLKTTMPFHDYFLDGIPLKKKPDSLHLEEGALPEISILRFTGVFLAVAAAVYFLLQAIGGSASHLLWLLHVFLAALTGLLVIIMMAKHAGEKSFPAAPDATLPDVLKALYLRDHFTRFAIDNQLLAAGDDEASAKELQARFQTFAAAHDPKNVAAPTQGAGTIGMGA